MGEKINLFKSSKSNYRIAADRDDFYKEQVKSHKKGNELISEEIEIIVVLLFNEYGDILIQKRSDKKHHNAGLLDKSIGGHIKYGDSVNYTVMVESVQELKVPSIVLNSEKEFKKTFDLLKDHLGDVAVVRHISTDSFILERIIDGEKINIGNRVHLFFGVYSGSIKAADREAKGVLEYSIDDLKDEMNKNPELFTSDLKFFIDKFYDEINKFIDMTKTK